MATNTLGSATFSNPLYKGTTTITGVNKNADPNNGVGNYKAPLTTTYKAPTATAPSGGGTGGGTNNITANTGGGGGDTNTYIDPYAQWGGKAQFDSLMGGWNDSKNATYGSITTAQDESAGKYHSGILDYLEGLKAGQGNLDFKTINNELAKKQGGDSILKTVGNGIRSSGVHLANNNASSSSAARQLAEAWGMTGRDMMSDVNNQFELGANNITNEQNMFDAANNTTLRHIGENKTSMVNSIVNDAVTQLSELNAKAAYASLPERVGLESEKERIKNETLNKLSAFDGELTEGKKKVAPISKDNAMAKAFELSNAGKASTAAFNIPTVNQMNTENHGLPLQTAYPIPRKDNL